MFEILINEKFSLGERNANTNLVRCVKEKNNTTLYRIDNWANHLFSSLSSFHRRLYLWNHAYTFPPSINLESMDCSLKLSFFDGQKHPVLFAFNGHLLLGGKLDSTGHKVLFFPSVLLLSELKFLFYNSVPLIYNLLF